MKKASSNLSASWRRESGATDNNMDKATIDIRLKVPFGVRGLCWVIARNTIIKTDKYVFKNKLNPNPTQLETE